MGGTHLTKVSIGGLIYTVSPDLPATRYVLVKGQIFNESTNLPIPTSPLVALMRPSNTEWVDSWLSTVCRPAGWFAVIGTQSGVEKIRTTPPLQLLIDIKVDNFKPLQIPISISDGSTQTLSIKLTRLP
jgi:hypothetical protein